MEADHRAWPQPLDEREKRGRLGLRRRVRTGTERDVAGVVGPALVADWIGTPVRRREVAIEIDSPGVAASSAQHSVRVGAENHRSLQLTRGQAAERLRHDHRRLRFIAVNRGEDDHLGAARLGEIDGQRHALDRGAVNGSGVADQASIAALDQSLNECGGQALRLHGPDYRVNVLRERAVPSLDRVTAFQDAMARENGASFRVWNAKSRGFFATSRAKYVSVRLVRASRPCYHSRP